MRQASRLRRLGAVALLAGSLLVTGCSGDDGDDPGSSESGPALPTGDAPTFAIETTSRLGSVTGVLPKQNRKHIEKATTDVVQRWFEAAYVGGDFPRKDFGDAFPGFTAGARARAEGDRDLMSNAKLGPKVDTVTPTVSTVRVDVLAVRKHAVGVTAHFTLGFKTEGDVEQHVRVQGRLYLSGTEDGWRVFGYDVTRGSRA